MAADIQLLDSTGSSERTIIFDGDIHPYHILQSKVHSLKSDFAWLLREGNLIGIIYVDFFRSEKVIVEGKATVVWSYYSIPFGLKKSGWEIIDPKDQSQTKQLVQITAKTAAAYVHELMYKLKTLNLAKLKLTPEVAELMKFEKESVQPIHETKRRDENLFCTADYRLNPIDKHSAQRSFVYNSCSKHNLDQAAVQKAIRNGEMRKSFFARLLDMISFNSKASD